MAFDFESNLRRADNDRRFWFDVSETLHKTEIGDAPEWMVDNHDMRMNGDNPIEAIESVGGNHHLVVFLIQGFGEVVADDGIVGNNENTLLCMHVSLLPPSFRALSWSWSEEAVL